MQILQRIKLWVIILFILVSAALFFVSPVHQIFTFSFFRRHLSILQRYVHDDWWGFSICFILVYSVAVSIPAGAPAVLSVLAGMLFPLPVAIAYVCISEVLGGLVIYAMSNAFFGRKEVWLGHKKMEFIYDKLQENAVSIVLFLRFLCVFPCWLLNVVSGSCGLSVRSYCWVTLIGSLPAAITFSMMGSGVDHVLKFNSRLALAELWRPEFIGPIAFLLLMLLAYQGYLQYSRSP